jgi:hypothetical protein
LPIGFLAQGQHAAHKLFLGYRLTACTLKDDPYSRPVFRKLILGQLPVTIAVGAVEHRFDKLWISGVPPTGWHVAAAPPPGPAPIGPAPISPTQARSKFLLAQLPVAVLVAIPYQPLEQSFLRFLDLVRRDVAILVGVKAAKQIAAFLANAFLAEKAAGGQKQHRARSEPCFPHD